MCKRCFFTVSTQELSDHGCLPARFPQLEANLHFPLTPREREVFTCLKLGKTCWATAVIIGSSVETVKKHCLHIYRKLGVNNAVEAANCVELEEDEEN